LRPLSAFLGAVLGWTVLVAFAGVAHAEGAGAPAAAGAEPVRLEAGAEPPHALALGRAAFAWRTGDLHGVVAALAPIDFALEPDFGGADRAAFLLAQAYLALGDAAAFDSLAAATASWSRVTPFTRWLAVQRVMIAAGDAPGDGDAAAIAADRLRRAGHTAAALERLAGSDTPLALYAKALAQQAAGEDPMAALEGLAGADTTTALGRELAGFAGIALAARAIAAGRDPAPSLTRVPASGPYAGAARHVRGLHALESGDTALARALLESAAADSGLATRDEARLALAGLALDREAWAEAWTRYHALDQARAARREALEGLRAGPDFAGLWAAWRGHAGAAPALVLDGDAARRAGAALADAATRLHGAPEAAWPVLERLRAAAPAPAPPPTADEWSRDGEASRALDQARAALDAHRHAIEVERNRLSRQRDYFGAGRAHVAREIGLLEQRAAVLDSLRATLDALDARIRGVRDAAIARVARRTARVIERGAAHLAWLGAMRHLHLEGAPHAAERLAPAGYPSSDSLVAAEERLARALIDAAQRMADGAPDLIARSYAEAWRPGLIDRTAAQADRAHELLAWAAQLAVAVDSNLAAAASSTRLETLAARTARLEDRVAFRVAAYRARADSIARAVIDRALEALAAGQEAIDYGLSAAAYGASVDLTLRAAADSAGTVASAAEAAGDSASAVWRARAIAAMRTFLERHPRSFARAEMRFRLADALLTDARERFRGEMARFVARQEAGEPTGAPPLLDHADALALYTAILDEDPDFEHRDAVLFNSGMILADAGDLTAEGRFGELVEQHPGSPYAQESWLRMGDLRFGERDYGAAVPRYAQAAEGADPNLRAMALYKLGWSHSNEDRFMDAADAFRRAMDLYASPERARITADIEEESETWLVHALARAGGASAFESYFERVGRRDYDLPLLMALADHFRRYSMFEEAAAAEAMCVARHPLHADALEAGERLPETWQRAGNGEAARAAQLDGATHFAPDGAWARAQDSDSVRAAGAAFARRAWTTVALHHHAEGRRTGRAADWIRALELYGTLIRTWPDDPETAEFHLLAGEASARLDDPVRALGHYRTAADAGADSTAERALRQRVAVTDAWYEKTRATHGGAAGRDSLAEAVLAAADELLERFPAHEGGADIRWRQGNLSLAHGWHERAARDFGRLADAWPADPRAPAAAGLRADALFRLERFDAAGEAFEAARLAAERAGADSIARHAAGAVPIAWYRHAESVAAKEPGDHRRQAETFAQFAARFPDYEHAHLAQYRAGLAWQKAGERERAVAAMQTLIERFPQSEFVRDAHLQIAATWEAAGEKRRAAEAYEAFAGRYAADSAAAEAWLRSADLYEAADLAPRAEALRLAYLERYPDDHAAAMEILEPLVRRDLAAVSPTVTLSSLLAAPAKGAAPSALRRYMGRAARHPDLASRALLAEVRFLEGEEARSAYEAVRLTQPLEKSIARRQAGLDTLLARYRRAIDMGVTEWAHAGAYRIGEALVGFGAALEQSERPADISGDDRLAYEDVLVEKAHAFYDRGEQVWEDLLRGRTDDAAEDRWVAEARGALWKRLGERFYFRPEVEFPLVEAEAPAPGVSANEAETNRKDDSTRTVARREDATR